MMTMRSQNDREYCQPSTQCDVDPVCPHKAIANLFNLHHIDQACPIELLST